jgi:DNA-binding SARP family transcriptional activator/tetratricopeptide (TPR) repeat protein
VTVEFRLLGRLEAEHDGKRVQLVRRRERCLLGVLLLQPGKAVSVEHLVDLLWDGDPPPTARSMLRISVSRLRAQLDPEGTGGPGVRLLSRDGGYLVEVDPHRIDAHRFQSLVRRARAAEPATRARLLREALLLWRGPVLADVAAPRLRERIAAALTESRASATELMIDSELACGRHRELIGELSALVADHPHRERLAGQLMLALYRSDRYADALAAYRSLRDRLVEDLGVDPGPDLRELHAAILRRDAKLPHSPAPGGVPAQLPAAPADFTGRTEELAVLTKSLTARVDHGATMVIGGAGGIGKTWLALHWAHQHLDRYPDGQLFLNLRGFDPTGRPMPPTEAVQILLHALGVAAAQVPAEFDMRVGLYRSLVAHRRILIVLDNARDTAQVADLLPGTASCAVLVTSRDRLPGLVSRHGARPVSLDLLDGPDARALLARRLGEERLAGAQEAVTALVRGCEGLPLALSIVAARAAIQPGLPLACIAADLRDATTRLAALDDDDAQASLRAVFSWSYQALTTPQSAAFRLLGLSPGPDVSLPAAAALTGLPADQAVSILRGLERRYLVEQHAPGRWRMHDLVRLYAAEQARCDLTAEARTSAVRRIVDFYLHTAHGAARLLDPHRSPITLAEPAGQGRPHPLSDGTEALAWFDAEHAGLLDAQRLAVECGLHDPVWQLSWTLDPFHGRRARVHDNVTIWQAGLAAARHTGSTSAQALAHRRLGNALIRAGRHAEAAAELRAALAFAGKAGDLPGQAHTHLALAQASEQQGDNERALEHARQALHLYQALDNPVRQANALNTVGWYLSRLGDHTEARSHLEAALHLARRNRDRDVEADTLDSLGYLAHHASRHTEALGHYQQALAAYRRLGNTYGEADTLDRVGATHADLRHRDQARSAWQMACALYQNQGRPAEADRVQRQLDRLGTGAVEGERPCG